jgi:hypothetical protein
MLKKILSRLGAFVPGIFYSFSSKSVLSKYSGPEGLMTDLSLIPSLKRRKSIISIQEIVLLFIFVLQVDTVISKRFLQYEVWKDAVREPIDLLIFLNAN